MTTKLITGTGLQLLRRYDKKAESYKAQLLDDVMFLTQVLLAMTYILVSYKVEFFCLVLRLLLSA